MWSTIDASTPRDLPRGLCLEGAQGMGSTRRACASRQTLLLASSCSGLGNYSISGIYSVGLMFVIIGHSLHLRSCITINTTLTDLNIVIICLEPARAPRGIPHSLTSKQRYGPHEVAQRHLEHLSPLALSSLVDHTNS